MTADILLVTLRSLGVSLSASGDRIKFRAPAGVMTLELRAALATQKPSILATLRVSELQVAEVSGRLSRGRGWAALRSHVLAEIVVFRRDEQVRIPDEFGRFVSYTRAELEILSTATPSVLRKIHRAKKISGGRVTALNAIDQNAVPSLVP